MNARLRRGLTGVLAAVCSIAGVVTAEAQVDAVYSRGIPELIHRPERLGTTASVLHIGAHPDDEDSALIARLARGDHARVAYLSLNRGEGSARPSRRTGVSFRFMFTPWKNRRDASKSPLLLRSPDVGDGSRSVLSARQSVRG